MSLTSSRVRRPFTFRPDSKARSTSHFIMSHSLSIFPTSIIIIPSNIKNPFIMNHTSTSSRSQGPCDKATRSAMTATTSNLSCLHRCHTMWRPIWAVKSSASALLLEVKMSLSRFWAGLVTTLLSVHLTLDPDWSSSSIISPCTEMRGSHQSHLHISTTSQSHPSLVASLMKSHLSTFLS